MPIPSKAGAQDATRSHTVASIAGSVAVIVAVALVAMGVVVVVVAVLVVVAVAVVAMVLAVVVAVLVVVAVVVAVLVVVALVIAVVIAVALVAVLWSLLFIHPIYQAQFVGRTRTDYYHQMAQKSRLLPPNGSKEPTTTTLLVVVVGSPNAKMDERQKWCSLKIFATTHLNLQFEKSRRLKNRRDGRGEISNGRRLVSSTPFDLLLKTVKDLFSQMIHNNRD